MAEIKAKDVFRNIVVKHLKKHFGSFEKHRPDSNKFWKVGRKVIRLYYYPDPRTELFITAISKDTLKSIENENAYFVGANYYLKHKNMFTVYFVHPEVIKKLYVNVRILRRAGNNEWHIKIKHLNNDLIFYRKERKNAVRYPIDKNNNYVQFKMTSKEYRKLTEVLPKRRNPLKSGKSV